MPVIEQEKVRKYDGSVSQVEHSGRPAGRANAELRSGAQTSFSIPQRSSQTTRTQMASAGRRGAVAELWPHSRRHRPSSNNRVRAIGVMPSSTGICQRTNRCSPPQPTRLGEPMLAHEIELALTQEDGTSPTTLVAGGAPG